MLRHIIFIGGFAFLSIAGSTDDLALGFGYYPPHLLEYFNSILKDTDFIGTALPMVDSLSRIQKGLKGTKSSSASELISRYSEYEGKVVRIAYNMEHWPLTPDSEKADPVGTVRNLAQFAHEHGLLLTLGPDRRFDDSHGDSMVLYVDHYVLQLQAFEAYPDTFKFEAFRRIERLRKANPSVFIIVQVSVSRNVSLDTIYKCIEIVSDSIDGVWIFYRIQDSTRLKRLTEMIRPCLGIEKNAIQSFHNLFWKKNIISYCVTKRGEVTVKVYDIRGRLIKTLLNKVQEIGEYTLVWDGRDDKQNKVSAGVYFWEIRTGRKTKIGKIIIIE